jgi:putative phosphoesterase
MQIGIISDTHNILPKSVFEHFKNVNYIFHAGDIGNFKIIDELKKIAPVYAIYGNIDSGETRKKVPAIKYIEIEGFIICLVHDIGSVKNFCYELFKNGKKADIVIFGHMHKPSYEVYQKTTFINPGSASYPRNHKNGTVAIIDLDGNSISHRFIDLKD